MVKRQFPCLSLGLKVNVNHAAVITVAAFVLNNIAVNASDKEPEVENNVFVGTRL